VASAVFSSMPANQQSEMGPRRSVALLVSMRLLDQTTTKGSFYQKSPICPTDFLPPAELYKKADVPPGWIDTEKSEN